MKALRILVGYDQWSELNGACDVLSGEQIFVQRTDLQTALVVTADAAGLERARRVLSCHLSEGAVVQELVHRYGESHGRGWCPTVATIV